MRKIKDFFIISAGAVIYAISVVIFTAPNNIAPGGVTGIATMINYLFSLPVGTFILLLNVPLFFLGYKLIGKDYVKKSLFGTIIVSVSIDLLDLILVPYKGDIMLASIFGGVLNGIGLAIIFSRGGSTGGTDIVATAIHKKVPHISMGHIILLSDILIIFLASVIYGSIESGLYAMISIFFSAKLIDIIIYGISRNNGKLMIIITKEYETISDMLLSKISRGVTIIDAIGGYSGSDIKVLICALRPEQVFLVNQITKKIDEKAFIIVTTAENINGEGFVDK